MAVQHAVQQSIIGRPSLVRLAAQDAIESAGFVLGESRATLAQLHLHLDREDAIEADAKLIEECAFRRLQADPRNRLAAQELLVARRLRKNAERQRVAMHVLIARQLSEYDLEEAHEAEISKRLGIAVGGRG